MDNTELTVLVERCVITINTEPFFNNSTLANIRKLFRYAFQEPWRNTETIATLGRYLPARVAESKLLLDADPTNKRNKRIYEHNSKILAAFETVKSKTPNVPNEI